MPTAKRTFGMVEMVYRLSGRLDWGGSNGQTAGSEDVRSVGFERMLRLISVRCWNVFAMVSGSARAFEVEMEEGSRNAGFGFRGHCTLDGQR